MGLVQALASPVGELILRPFEPGDFAALKNWFRNEDEARVWGGPAVHFPIDDRQLALMLNETIGASAPRRCWSLDLECDLVGHAQAVREDPGSVRLARIAIAPGWRSHGIGRALLRAIIDEILSEPEIAQVTLKVYHDNVGAYRFYRNLGFADVGPAGASTRSQGAQVESRRMLLERATWLLRPVSDI